MAKHRSCDCRTYTQHRFRTQPWRDGSCFHPMASAFDPREDYYRPMIRAMNRVISAVGRHQACGCRSWQGHDALAGEGYCPGPLATLLVERKAFDIATQQAVLDNLRRVAAKSRGDLKTPVAYGGQRPLRTYAVVRGGDGKPIAEVDMTDGDGRLSVGWPCRLDLIVISGDGGGSGGHAGPGWQWHDPRTGVVWKGGE